MVHAEGVWIFVCGPLIAKVVYTAAKDVKFFIFHFSLGAGAPKPSLYALTASRYC
jgi:hypothetical protein